MCSTCLEFNITYAINTSLTLALDFGLVVRAQCMMCWLGTRHKFEPYRNKSMVFKWRRVKGAHYPPSFKLCPIFPRRFPVIKTKIHRFVSHVLQCRSFVNQFGCELEAHAQANTTWEV